MSPGRNGTHGSAFQIRIYKGPFINNVRTLGGGGGKFYPNSCELYLQMAPYTNWGRLKIIEHNVFYNPKKSINLNMILQY